MGLGHDTGVVVVEDGDALVGQARDQVALLVRDLFPASQELNMRGTDIGDDANVGSRNCGESCNFAPMVHAQFDHRLEVFLLSGEQGQRQAEFVVQVSVILQTGAGNREDAVNQFFGGCFSVAPGDCDDGSGEAVPVAFGQGTERLSRIGHRQGTGAGGRRILRKPGLLDDQSGCPPRQGITDEFVRIVALAPYGQEELSRGNASGIDPDSEERAFFGARDPAAPCPIQCVLRAESNRHAGLRRARALRASSRSSKGSFSRPTI